MTKYSVGTKRVLTKPQTDNDAVGRTRHTSQGEVIQITAIHSGENLYEVCCPKNGAGFFFSEAELDNETTRTR